MKITLENLTNSINSSQTMQEAFVKSGLKNFQTFRKYAKLNGLWNPNPSGKGTHKKPARQYLLEDILSGKHPGYPSSKLKRRLVEERVLEDKCSECDQGPVWNNKPLSLQLDHINGVNTDNRKENLRLLCPNCHTQTSTFGALNR